MFYRKDVVLMAVAGLLASSGFATAETKSGLSLDPSVMTADACWARLGWTSRSMTRA
jgi:hypothetical protein